MISDIRKMTISIDSGAFISGGMNRGLLETCPPKGGERESKISEPFEKPDFRFYEIDGFDGRGQPAGLPDIGRLGEPPLPSATTKLQRNPAPSGTDGLFTKPSSFIFPSLLRACP